MTRVVITGMAGLCPIGSTWKDVSECLRNGTSGITNIPEWSEYQGLDTNLGARVNNLTLGSYYTPKRIRSMGRVALLATKATELALDESGLLGSQELQSGDMGIAYGSSSGSPDALAQYSVIPMQKHLKGIAATTYIKMMSHTCATNVAIFYGIRGRVLSTATGCTSGSQAIGYAYESIRNGAQKLMIAGGAEELSVMISAVFDVMNATSRKNSTPNETPKPFDRDRDGLVIGEGACSFILEDLAHARARGAKILAEVTGFATNCDGAHITNPSPPTMAIVMRQALSNARLPASAIGYINAHATGTKLGDTAEAAATRQVFGDRTPISSAKGHIGHTLGAAGALESWMSVQMMREGWFSPTLNLKSVDPACAGLDHIQDTPRSIDAEYVMSNNFAFGGINTSLVFKKW